MGWVGGGGGLGGVGLVWLVGGGGGGRGRRVADGLAGVLCMYGWMDGRVWRVSVSVRVSV